MAGLLRTRTKSNGIRRSILNIGELAFQAGMSTSIFRGPR